jgi:GNAT superfamily N-acetyltransferase
LEIVRGPTTLARDLAAALPDEPRWIEARAMLLSGQAEITGGGSVDGGFVVKILHGALSAIAVVGLPPGAAIVAATKGITSMTPVLAQTDNAAHVGQALAGATGATWSGERMILHRLGSQPEAPAPTRELETRLLRRDDPLDHLPAGLRHEMTHARKMVPVAVVIADGVPASFCYPCWRTETLWDVSIDTLEQYRGRELGQRATAFMIELMRRDGREPIWGALESNTASLRLAAKLGFAPDGAIVCFSRGPWALMSGGFDG